MQMAEKWWFAVALLTAVMAAGVVSGWIAG
jgi:hypothetical protein